MENHKFLQDLDFMQEISREQIVEFFRGESLIEQPTMAGYIQAQEQELIRDDVGGKYGVPSMSTPEMLMVEPGVVSVEANMVDHGGHQYPLSENWEEGDQEEKEGENSSGTTSIVANCRSRTLVAERKRRGNMKEKLYALRALVPNITKVPFSYVDITFALLD